MTATRVAVALALAALVALAGAAARAARRRVARAGAGTTAEPDLPSDLLGGAPRTWVVFTSPWCARCGPVVERLRRDDPGAHVVTVDVADRPDLARRYRVRSAPTVLLADAAGRVQARRVGGAPVAGSISIA